MEQPSPEPQPIPEISPEELQAFRERFSASLEESLDFFDGEDFLILQPMDLHIEDDERIMDELQVQEKSAITEMLAQHLELDFNDPEAIIDTYQFEGPVKEDNTPSIVTASIFSTNREEIFIHKVVYENGDILFVAGSKDQKFS